MFVPISPCITLYRHASSSGLTVALRWRAQLEDMANAIDTEKGVEEVNQPWLPQGEETVRTIRTPDDSDIDGDT